MMRTPRTLCTTAGLLAASLIAPVYAQAPVPAAPDVGDEVVVRGQRMSDIRNGLRAEIGKFIGEIAATPAGRGFARWDGSVCVGVHNLEQTAAQYLVDRISLLARDVGLRPGEPGCGPDVIIIFTTDGRQLASYIAEEQPGMLRPTGEGGVHRGFAGVDEFVASDKAVRWWQLSLPVDARTGAPAIAFSGRDAPWVSVAGPSRIHSGISDALQRVIVIVDSTKLTGTTWQQLGDYLAVVSLAQVDLAANPASFDTILNLFTNPAAYSGLTDWDRTYVQALYRFDQERIPRLQTGELTAEMLRLELGPELDE